VQRRWAAIVHARAPVAPPCILRGASAMRCGPQDQRFLESLASAALYRQLSLPGLQCWQDCLAVVAQSYRGEQYCLWQVLRYCASDACALLQVASTVPRFDGFLLAPPWGCGCTRSGCRHCMCTSFSSGPARRSVRVDCCLCGRSTHVGAVQLHCAGRRRMVRVIQSVR
jgi:hypothetical protein